MKLWNRLLMTTFPPIHCPALHQHCLKASSTGLLCLNWSFINIVITLGRFPAILGASGGLSLPKQSKMSESGPKLAAWGKSWEMHRKNIQMLHALDLMHQKMLPKFERLRRGRSRTAAG